VANNSRAVHQATNLKDLQIPMLLPGIAINTGAEDYIPIKQMQNEPVYWRRWEQFGPVFSGKIGS
jgi:branched-chain amino acid transport system substrate-binding protein